MDKNQEIMEAIKKVIRQHEQGLKEITIPEDSLVTTQMLAITQLGVHEITMATIKGLLGMI